MLTDARIQEEYRRWRGAQLDDETLQSELAAIENDPAAIEDRFYRDLEFGTAGLRGVLGAGTNRMNVYTVSRASRGFARDLTAREASPSVCIAYDSRINSERFARTAAAVFAQCGVRVYLYAELMPTPALSFAVRYLHASGGVNITASHNPARYNGYKVYGSDGCQIGPEDAARILREIEGLDVLADVGRDFERYLQAGQITWIEESVVAAFLQKVSAQAIDLAHIDKNVSIVYTPLHGAGLRCVTTVLKQNGFTQVAVVPEQAQPDGNFPTCPYPNPETREALACGLAYAKKLGSDLLLATDPDCDRVGIAVRDGADYRLLTGNQVGVLLLDYICAARLRTGKMPDRPVAVKTIVSTELAARVATAYGVELKNVLTGFKFIGEQIALLEAKGEEERFILGFEESYGYLTGGYVRDKDAVDASLLIAEMFAYYKGQGLSLPAVLETLYQKHGYYTDSVKSFAFEGADGLAAMRRIMEGFRASPPAPDCAGACKRRLDYQSAQSVDERGNTAAIDLPASNVLQYEYADATVVVRPSGTEPKLKVYFSSRAASAQAGAALDAALHEAFTALVQKYAG